MLHELSPGARGKLSMRYKESKSADPGSVELLFQQSLAASLVSGSEPAGHNSSKTSGMFG